MTSTTHDLQERYGVAPPWRRPVVIAVAVVLAVALGGWTAWTIYKQSTPLVESNIETYKIVDEHSAQAVLDVRLKDASVKATCRLIAYSADHSVVGELSFAPDPSTAEQQQTVTTERRATSVEAGGCTAAGQKHPR